MTRPNQWLVLFGFVVLCLAAGGVGGLAVSQAIVDWYPTLNKPSWNPPSWVFGPVWTVLYVLMAIAAWLVWKKDVRLSGVRVALMLFFAQLVFNCLWSFAFFKLRSPAIGLVDIVILLALLLLTTRAFFNQSKAAGVLLLPYVAWASFATVLNFTIWRLN
jgi:benzodiazapine receptor